MNEYQAPLADMKFLLRELVDPKLAASLPGLGELSPDVAESILDEAAKFAAQVLSPLNRSGDREGVRLEGGTVRTAAGWKQAYGRFVADGWGALSCPAEYGGQNLPRVLSALVEEMWNGANLSFALCPMLTRGAIEALEFRGSREQKESLLPSMVSGEWTGTMVLTEPQAGSDLSAVRTRAEPTGDGRYKLFGQKIFITYGDHDLTGNIVHMVLARTPNAPDGVKGISLFVVPKFLLDADGSPGERNDVQCVSTEHKLGIHASPTCVLAFGQSGGAIGELIGEENRGLEYMFIMMNAARFSVGIEGIGIAERAYQTALSFARERIQSADAAARGGGRVPILRHPDVRRMLLTMRSRTEAMRALAVVAAQSLDAARLHPGADERRRHQAFVDLMIPVIKGWCTESSVELASLGIQVHGGMGFVEETGAAQFLRDARITPIYEGTTGIQATDLVGRKLGRDGGQAARAVIGQMRRDLQELSGVAGGAISARVEIPGSGPAKDPCSGSAKDHGSTSAGHQAFAAALAQLHIGIESLEGAVEHVVRTFPKDIRAALAGAVPLLELFGIVAGGWQLLRCAGISIRRRREGGAAGDPGFHEAKIATACFYASHVLPRAGALEHAVVHGAQATLDEAAL